MFYTIKYRYVKYRYVFFQENIVTTGLNSGISVIYFVNMTFSRLITATEAVCTTWRCVIAPVTLMTIFTASEPLILGLIWQQATRTGQGEEMKSSEWTPGVKMFFLWIPRMHFIPTMVTCCQWCGTDLAKGVMGSSAGALGRSRVGSRFKLRISHSSGGGGTGGGQTVQTDAQ